MVKFHLVATSNLCSIRRSSLLGSWINFLGFGFREFSEGLGRGGFRVSRVGGLDLKTHSRGWVLGFIKGFRGFSFKLRENWFEKFRGGFRLRT